MSEKTNASEMKIYFGPNKSKARLVTLKELISYTLNIKNSETEVDRFDDNSASWIQVRQPNNTGVIDITICFDPENDATITEMSIFSCKWKLDEDSAKNLLK